MQCKSCGYRLWNLPSRQCPECGAHFRPSDFEFVPGAVAFCCPGCDKAYYGTSPTGHLIPQRFTCIGCGQALDMDAMVLRPAEGVDESRTEAGGIPWTRRSEIGFWRAMVRTTRMALLQPSGLVCREPRADEGSGAWKYAAWSLLLSLLGSFGVIVFFEGVFLFLFIGPSSAGPAEIGIFALVGTLGLAFGVLGSLLYILIWGLTVQGVLRVTGGGHRPLAQTNRALCYSAGASMASIVPCLGWYFGWIWWLVSAVLMVKATHRISGGRAALAVLALPVCGFMVLGGLYVFVIVTSLSTMSTMTMTMPAFGAPGAGVQQETQMLLDGYRDYAQAEGAFPLHPLLMMDDNPIGASHFVASDTSSLVDDVKWRTLRLSALQIMSPQARRKQIDAFVAGLPEGAIAHRAGDFVFTCPGVDPAALTADVWLVIYSPMPEVRQTHNPFAASVYVGQADGTVIVIPKATFQNSLRAQRATRRRNNLPPLPDLSSITHNRPAVADAGDGS